MSSPLPNPHLVVRGYGSVTVEPDLAHVSVELRAANVDPAAAKQHVDDRSKAVVLLATRCGIDRRDVTAAHIAIRPKYNWKSDKKKYVGTLVSRDISLVLRDLEKFETLIQGLAEIPIFALEKVKMDTSKRLEYEQAAMDAAAADAQKKASQLAQGLGVGLKSVYRIAPPDYGDGFGSFDAMMATGGGTFEIGTIDIQAKIEITYWLESAS